ncbi:MAG: DoxX family protein [Rhodobacter sp.]|nr:DoxX family protein [Rhodobacter sp.]MCY4169844.1 DoxX family protein [Rhodobacter sp.]
MNELVSLYDSLVDRVERLAPVLLPTAARFVFAAVLLVYYWNSGLTKLGGEGIHGLFGPTFNAFAQIFPKGAEAVGYDITQASLLQKLVILGGTWAEFMLPAAIVLGLLTRLASIGMIGFIIVQSLTDIWGHGADAGTIGAWFDIHSGALILDQRAFWAFLLLYLAMRGAGPLSLDAAAAAFLRRGSPDGAGADRTPAS